MALALPGHRARRWVGEGAHSWLNRLLVRWEKKAANYLGLRHLAGAVITGRKGPRSVDDRLFG